jgi:hypothetical protein
VRVGMMMGIEKRIERDEIFTRGQKRDLGEDERGWQVIRQASSCFLSKMKIKVWRFGLESSGNRLKERERERERARDVSCSRVRRGICASNVSKQCSIRQSNRRRHTNSNSTGREKERECK